MKTISRFTALALLFVTLVSVPAYGWSDTGHMAVAYVAYQRLTPQTRSRVNTLVRLNPRYNAWLQRIPSGTSASRRRLMLFMIAATWPDEIKGLPGYIEDGAPGSGGNRPPNDGTADRNIGYSDMSMHKYWHFVDLPFSTDGTTLEDPPVPNAETMIAAFRVVLASNSPDALKSYDLAWLLHIVGDVHQPLHGAARFTQSHPHGDDGGNKVFVREGTADPRRLHSFWDGILGTSRSPAFAISVGQTLPVPSVGAASNLDANAWIRESFELAKSTVYRPPIGPGDGPFAMTNNYRNSTRTLARRRVALGGARLANVLNSELR
jgi:S1/P1 nuclease